MHGSLGANDGRQCIYHPPAKCAFWWAIVAHWAGGLLTKRGERSRTPSITPFDRYARGRAALCRAIINIGFLRRRVWLKGCGPARNAFHRRPSSRDRPCPWLLVPTSSTRRQAAATHLDHGRRSPSLLGEGILQHCSRIYQRPSEALHWNNAEDEMRTL